MINKIFNVENKTRARIARLTLAIAKYIFGCVPKNKKLVLFNSWFGEKYADNSKYVFEYLLSNSEYRVFWLTKNEKIYEQLKEEGKPVVRYNSLKAKWLQMRCVVACSSVQFSDFNEWVLSNSILLDLNHGYPFKGNNMEHHTLNVLKDKIQLRFLKYYAIMPSQFCKNHYGAVKIQPDQIIISDFARNDVFFDKNLRLGINLNIEKIKKGRKAIVYMPTHRSDGHVLFDTHKILPLDEIEDLCECNGWEFIIKKHFYHRNEKEDFSKYNHIHDITDDSSIDSQVILYQANVLISDYSSSYIDYLLLDRPVILYHFDWNEFQQNERELFIPFEKLNFCPKPQTKEQLFKELKNICTSGIDEYAAKRHDFIPTYFENAVISEGRKKTKHIIDSLIEKHFG